MSPHGSSLEGDVGDDGVLRGHLGPGPDDADEHGLVHPGVLAHALTEAMARVLRHGDLAGRLEGLELRVEKPTVPGVELAIEARQGDFVAARIALEATATRPDGTLIATATATWVPLPDH